MNRNTARQHAGRPATRRHSTSAARRRPAALVGPQFRILFKEAIAIGPGKAELLQLIERTGSISAAARAFNMSYRRAWMLVDTMNQSFRKPVVATATGGRRGGGAHVTPFGRDVLRRYIALQKKAARSVRADLAAFRLLLAPTRRS